MNKKLSKNDLRKIIAEEVSLEEKRRSLKESESRKIPRYAVERIAEEAVASLKRQMVVYINQTSNSTSQSSQSMREASILLEELEEEMNKLISSKLGAFIRQS